MFFSLGQCLEFLIIFVKCEELIKSFKKKVSSQEIFLTSSAHSCADSVYLCIGVFVYFHIQEVGGHWLSVFLDPRKEMFKLTSDTKTVVKVKSITYELHIIYLKFIKFI